ncbi:hypothetical protein WJX72_006920 [[Myrmecia] bisecta]|uniref:Ras-related protein Rab-28 n=1 Tax=[Myrmecia] bisecta TaxID=41462 RepID=A0AAW1P219_9CHLO
MAGQAAPADSDEEAELLQFKVVVVGDGEVGKTSLSTRFTEDHFAQSYRQTIGVDFFLKQLTLPGDVHVAIQLWDIGGQTLSSKMVGNYVYGAHAVLYAYDITNLQSFQDLEDWHALVVRVCGRDRLPYLALIANKADLTHLRTVKPERHNQFADSNNMYSYFVSAKTGDNVATTFYRVAADLAGIVLTKPEVEVAAKAVTAQIIVHPQDLPADRIGWVAKHHSR